VYNEAATFPTLLGRVRDVRLPGLDKEIVIVEGNSSDGTRELVRGCEGLPGLRVIYEDRPGGKGAAVRAGLAAVQGEYLLVQDGDLEYDPADIPKLVQPLVAGEADVVFGSRVKDSPQHWQFRRFRGLERCFGFFVNLGGVLFTGMFNLLYGTRLSDGATMYKLFRTADLQALTLRSNGFDYDWEISGKLAKLGRRFVEMPVRYTARGRDEGKKIRFWRDGIRVLIAILRYRFAD
jgi:glycosyltransferase involved in cell wall biosynthesis